MNKKVKLILIALVAITMFTSCTNKKDENTLKVGIDLKYPPFMYLDDNKVPTGLEPDLARAFGKYIQRDVEIINTDFSMLIASLETGEVDIVISDMSITEKRGEKVDFTQGYRYSKTPALVNKNFYIENNISDDMDVEAFFNLPHLKSIGLSGTVGTIIPQKYGAKTVEATEIGTAIMEVTTGSANVLVGSYVIFGDHEANKDTTEIYLGIPDYTPSAFAVKKGNQELLNNANNFISTLYEKGGLYEQLEGKYDKTIGEVFFNDTFNLEYIVSKP